MTNTYTYGEHTDIPDEEGFYNNFVTNKNEEKTMEKIEQTISEIGISGSEENSWKFSSRPWQPSEVVATRNPARTFPPVTSPGSPMSTRAQTMPSKMAEEVAETPVSPSPASASVTGSPTASRMSMYKLSKKVGNGIRQELGELKEFSQYTIRTNVFWVIR
jgi:hypothetical protein